MRKILLFALLFLAACASAPPHAELILTGGRVFTGNDAQPWAEAIAIRGETIAAVGSDAEVRTLGGASTRLVDLGGRLVIPGINDAHMHEPWPFAGTTVDVPPDTPSMEAFLDILRRAAMVAPAGALLRAELPLHLVDASLTREELDAISTSHQIRVALLGGHGALLNTPALRAWSIAEGDGWIYEHAYWMALKREQEAATDDELRARIRAMEEFAIRYGITTIQTMPLLAPERIDAIIASVQPRVRWRIIDFRMAPYDGEPGRFPVKYIIDGTPIERGAAMREPWSDAPPTSGRLNYSVDDIEAMMRDAARGERQLLVHAVGDAAIATVFEAMKKTPADWPSRRVRIEHGDLLTPDLIPLARQLGVTVVQNPSHFMIRDLALVRLGPTRIAHAQPARSLIAAGIPFAIGSDGPPDPFLNIFFATVHAVNPSEALTVEQAVTAYTSAAARAEFEEQRKGTLAPGMLADLAVLSQDIFAVPPPQIPGTTSVMTIIGGKVVWEAAR